MQSCSLLWKSHNAERGLIPHCHQMSGFVIAGKPVRGRVASPLRLPILAYPSCLVRACVFR